MQENEAKTLLNEIRSKIKIKELSVSRTIKFQDSEHTLAMIMDIEKSSIEECNVAQEMMHLELESQLIKSALTSGDISEEEAMDRMKSVKSAYSKSILLSLRRLK